MKKILWIAAWLLCSGLTATPGLRAQGNDALGVAAGYETQVKAMAENVEAVWMREQRVAPERLALPEQMAAQPAPADTSNPLRIVAPAPQLAAQPVADVQRLLGKARKSGVCDTVRVKVSELPTSLNVPIQLMLAGEGEATIDWGDGTQSVCPVVEEYGNYAWTAYQHTYAFDDCEFMVYTSSPEVQIIGIQLYSPYSYNSGGRFQLFKNIDLRANPSLMYLTCTENKWSALDVSQNVNLTELDCSDNSLASLDVSKNVNLTRLDCSGNSLTSLDVSKNVNLTHLNCDANQLSSLDVSRNAALEYLYCRGNHLIAIDLSRNEALRGLSCLFNIREVELNADHGSDLSLWPDMDCERICGVSGGSLEGSVLYFDKERVTYRYATGYTGEADGFDTVEFGLTTVADTIRLTVFPIVRNVLYRLSLYSDREECYVIDWGDGSQEKYLSEGIYYTIYPEHTYEKEGDYNITISALQINGFSCAQSGYADWVVTSLDVSKCLSLQTLYCYGNTLLDLDLSRNVDLRLLSCSDNPLTSLDVSACPALSKLWCNNNGLSSLDVSQNTSLYILSCSNNQLSSLDVLQNTKLDSLVCCNNRLTRLEVGNCTELKALSCSGNALSSLDVGRNTELVYLNADGNALPLSAVSELLADVESNGLACYVASPQRLNVRIEAGEAYDLSGELLFNGMETEVVVEDFSGNPLPEDSYDLDFEKASVRFKTDGLYRIRMKNNALLSKTYNDGNHEQYTLKDTYSDDLYPVECVVVLEVGQCPYDALSFTWQVFSGQYMSKTERMAYFDFKSAEAGDRFTVDWGDGTAGSYVADKTGTVNPFHVYAKAGNYKVQITAETVWSKITEWGGSSNFDRLYRVKNLDVSGCTALEKLYCGSQGLSVLDVSGCTTLTVLSCADNQLTSLDVSANTALTRLDCGRNQLTSLDVSANTALTEMRCNYNHLTVDLDTVNSFDLSTLPGMDVSRIGGVTGGRLEGLRLIFEAERVTYQYATHFPGEASLGFDSVAFTLVASAPLTPTEPAVCDTIFMTWTAKSGWLNGFSFSGTAGETFTVDWGDGSDTVVMGKGTPWYSYVPYDHWLRHRYAEEGAYQVRLSATSQKGHITWFNCSGNGATSLDVGRCTALRNLYCHNNQLTSLDVTQNPALTELICEKNQLSSLDISQNENLTLVRCDFNQLTSIEVGQNDNLQSLQCHYNELSHLDVSGCPNLTFLGCGFSHLTSLYVGDCHKLDILSCEGNNLKTLDLSANPYLTYLGVAYNDMDSIDIRPCTRLERFYGAENHFSLSQVKGMVEMAYGHNPAVYHCLKNQLHYAERHTGEVLDLSLEMNLDVKETQVLVQVGEIAPDTLWRPAVSSCYANENGRIDFKQAGLYRVTLSHPAVWDNFYWDYTSNVYGDFTIDSNIVHVHYMVNVTGDPIDPSDPTDPTLPSDTLVPENGAGWIWLASAGEEKEVVFKGTGKGFRVDWGDGSASDAKGGAAPDADGAVSTSASASKDSEKTLTHRYAEEGVYTVTLAPLSQNGRLTDLDVSDGRVLALAFGDASMLEALDCSDNLLTELALSEATKLKDLDCSDNLLTALDLSGCAALQEADFSDNRLTSVSLPTHASLKEVEGEDNRLRLSSLYGLLSGRVKNASYGFDPQSDSVTVAENAVLDLASEMTVGGRATTYTLLDAATRRPAPASDYAAEGGLFRFFKPGARYLLTLRNANVTDYEKGRAATPVAFTYHVYVSGVGNEDLASDEAAAAPWAYVQGRTIYLTEPAGGAGLGEVEAFTAVGQRVYRGFDRAFTVPTAGVYVLRAADGRRCKVMVR